MTSSAGPTVRVRVPAIAGGRLRVRPVAAVIAAMTLLALALRVYQLSRPGYLLGVTEYDDGTDLGSAIRLIHGSIPYRDFIMVQPPGITLLMAPVALATKAMSTATTMAAGRVLTALAGAAAVAVAGLLVRHRGLLATTITSGILAIYPDSIQAAKTVLLEPWLVLFCLLGMVAVFDGDRLASRNRLIWGGVAFGFAGAVKVWAILPVLAMLALTARKPRRALAFGAGVVAGFAVPVLPFALTAPSTFYRSVIIAQLSRSDVTRIPQGYRLQHMLGLTHLPSLPTPVLTLMGIAVLAAIAAAARAGSRLGHRPPPALDVFALASFALVIVAFLSPVDFYYHYAAFLAPFLALALALPASALVAALPGAPESAARPGGAVPAGAGDGRARWAVRRVPSRRTGSGPPGLLRRAALPAAAGLLAVLAVVQTGAETRLASGVPGPELAAAQRLIPPGACVVTDQVAYPIAINRFISTVHGCPVMVDGVGTDYSLSGRNAQNGAGGYVAVRRFWMTAFQSAQYVWLTGQNDRRIPWTPALRSYFLAHFVPVSVRGDILYVRQGYVRQGQ